MRSRLCLVVTVFLEPGTCRLGLPQSLTCDSIRGAPSCPHSCLLPRQSSSCCYLRFLLALCPRLCVFPTCSGRRFAPTARPAASLRAEIVDLFSVMPLTHKVEGCIELHKSGPGGLGTAFCSVSLSLSISLCLSPSLSISISPSVCPSLSPSLSVHLSVSVPSSCPFVVYSPRCRCCLIAARSIVQGGGWGPWATGLPVRRHPLAEGRGVEPRAGSTGRVSVPGKPRQSGEPPPRLRLPPLCWCVCPLPLETVTERAVPVTLLTFRRSGSRGLGRQSWCWCISDITLVHPSRHGRGRLHSLRPIPVQAAPRWPGCPHLQAPTP